MLFGIALTWYTQTICTSRRGVQHPSTLGMRVLRATTASNSPH